MTRLIDRLLHRPQPAAPPVPVIVYSRQGCGCCQKALAVLDSMRDRYPIDVTVVDIDTDPELVRAHGQSVPVVEIQGKIRFRGQVNPVLLERLLRAGGSE